MEVVLRTKARFIPQDTSQEEWSIYTEEQKMDYADWANVCIPWDNIEFLNEATHGLTSVNLRSTSSMVIDMPYKKTTEQFAQYLSNK